jgi:uncharacterized protein (TIGR01319 family)
VDPVVCADFGSTFTKTLLVDRDTAAVVASAEHRTTGDTDVLDGLAACLSTLRDVEQAAARAPVLACSSAGGGLRIAVIGNEELVTAEAGRRVAESSGGRVVHVAAAGDRYVDVSALRAAEPDVVLLVGGTDGGNAEVLLGAAQSLRAAAWAGPVVVAGNADVSPQVSELLSEGAIAHEIVANVVPRIGVLVPDGARASIRAAFLSHVIGGKHLSASAEFARMVVGPTPDIVLTGAELVADLAGDVAVVDVGGATTDVHSVVAPDDGDSPLARQVVAPTRVTRTVEADLGMRWSAVSTVDRGLEAGLIGGDEVPELLAAARQRAADPGQVSAGAGDVAVDHRLAEVATTVAMRRHAGRQHVLVSGQGRVLERTGKDLRTVTLLIGSGGVLRHGPVSQAVGLLQAATSPDSAGGWLLPRSPRLVIDRAYVLAAAGLLAASVPDVAHGLLRRHLLDR